MRIVIETDGNSDNTSVSINGKELKNLIEFHVTAGACRRPKLVMVREIDKEKEVMSYFAGDFQKYDEYHPIKKES